MTNVERLLQSSLSQHFLTCNQTSTISSSSSSSFWVNAVSSAPPDVLHNCSLSPITTSVRLVNASTGSSTNLTQSGWQQCCTVQAAFTTELYTTTGSGGSSSSNGSSSGNGSSGARQGQEEEEEDSATTENVWRKLANTTTSTTTSFSSSGADTTITNPAVASVFGSFLSTLFTTSTSPFLAAQADILQLQFLGFTNGAAVSQGAGAGIDSTSITPSGTNGQPASAAALVGPQAAVPTRPDGRFIVASLGIGLTVIALITLLLVVARVRRRARERQTRRAKQAQEDGDLELYEETKEEETRRNEPDNEEDDGSITVLSDLKQLEWQRKQERQSAMARAHQQHDHDYNNNYNNDEEYPHDEEQLERENAAADRSIDRCCSTWLDQ